MIIHREHQLVVAFCDKQESFLPYQFYSVKSNAELINSYHFDEISKQYFLKDLLVLKQTHSAHGILFDTKKKINEYTPYAQEGDYLITIVPDIGIGVATADCLPIVIYDPLNAAVTTIHAGSKGSFQYIAQKALMHMHSACGTNPQNINVFFGPSARVCCYEVTEEFLDNIPSSYKEHTLEYRDKKLYFNLPRFNQLQLQNCGVPENASNLFYNHCTICDKRFCSYRREKEYAQRQMTIAVLNSKLCP